jgi:hypothetical protein
MNRRSFLTAATVLSGSSASTSALAADGGKPVRALPLRASYFGPEHYDDKELFQLSDVLKKRLPFRWYGPGSQPPMKVLTFERELATRMQTRFALAVTSGTAALTTALAALGVGPGDEVILPALSWYSCFNSIVMQGALPVFAESDESLNVDPADLESKITPQTKVIMVVHALGNPADMDAIMALARRRGSRCWKTVRKASEAATRASRWDRSVTLAFIVSSFPRRSAPAKGEAWLPAIRSFLSGPRATTTWDCSARRTSRCSGAPRSRG